MVVSSGVAENRYGLWIELVGLGCNSVAKQSKYYKLFKLKYSMIVYLFTDILMVIGENRLSAVSIGSDESVSQAAEEIHQL